MLRAFGVKDREKALPSLRDASDRISRRSDMVDEKIKRLDSELSKHREQIRRMRPGPAREATKARAARVLKQKKAYEGQRDTLDGRSFRLEQIAFAVEDIKDSQPTRSRGQSSWQLNWCFMCVCPSQEK
ncbi:hypothetical protein MLD38_008587 [Melastoma candidum]|uniref:Uncharacterized protein n=1 Tax=Melastoma candidum TaxID=119954 RepID=A0ACB9RU87_9MYRT|nr:hypothetical protein MLD38_008587 [Melastoma candidum]